MDVMKIDSLQGTCTWSRWESCVVHMSTTGAGAGLGSNAALSLALPQHRGEITTAPDRRTKKATMNRKEANPVRVRKL